MQVEERQSELLPNSLSAETLKGVDEAQQSSESENTSINLLNDQKLNEKSGFQNCLQIKGLKLAILLLFVTFCGLALTYERTTSETPGRLLSDTVPPLMSVRAYGDQAIGRIVRQQQPEDNAEEPIETEEENVDESIEEEPQVDEEEEEPEAADYPERAEENEEEEAAEEYPEEAEENEAEEAEAIEEEAAQSEEVENQCELQMGDDPVLVYSIFPPKEPEQIINIADQLQLTNGDDCETSFEIVMADSSDVPEELSIVDGFVVLDASAKQNLYEFTIVGTSFENGEQKVVVEGIQVQLLCQEDSTELVPPQITQTSKTVIGSDEWIMVFGEFESSAPACPVESIKLKSGDFEIYVSGGSFMLRKRESMDGIAAFELEATAAGGASVIYSGEVQVAGTCFIQLGDDEFEINAQAGEEVTIFQSGADYASTTADDCGLAYALSGFEKDTGNGIEKLPAELDLDEQGALKLQVDDANYKFSIIVMGEEGHYQLLDVHIETEVNGNEYTIIVKTETGDKDARLVQQQEVVGGPDEEEEEIDEIDEEEEEASDEIDEEEVLEEVEEDEDTDYEEEEQGSAEEEAGEEDEEEAEEQGSAEEEAGEAEEEEQEEEIVIEVDLSFPEYPEPAFEDGCPVVTEDNTVEYDFCALHENFRAALFYFTDKDNNGQITVHQLQEQAKELSFSWGIFNPDGTVYTPYQPSNGKNNDTFFWGAKRPADLEFMEQKFIKDVHGCDVVTWWEVGEYAKQDGWSGNAVRAQVAYNQLLDYYGDQNGMLDATDWQEMGLDKVKAWMNNFSIYLTLQGQMHIYPTGISKDDIVTLATLDQFLPLKCELDEENPNNSYVRLCSNC